MLNDVKCPYCGAGQEINHDDGYGYEEEMTHLQECSACEKTFSFQTSISFDYEADKCDCQNESDCHWVPTPTFPKECTKMMCTMCDERRPCTEDEMNKIMSEDS